MLNSIVPNLFGEIYGAIWQKLIWYYPFHTVTIVFLQNSIDWIFLLWMIVLDVLRFVFWWLKLIWLMLLIWNIVALSVLIKVRSRVYQPQKLLEMLTIKFTYWRNFHDMIIGRWQENFKKWSIDFTLCLRFLIFTKNSKECFKNWLNSAICFYRYNQWFLKLCFSLIH